MMKIDNVMVVASPLPVQEDSPTSSENIANELRLLWSNNYAGNKTCKPMPPPLFTMMNGTGWQ